MTGGCVPPVVLRGTQANPSDGTSTTSFAARPLNSATFTGSATGIGPPKSSTSRATRRVKLHGLNTSKPGWFDAERTWMRSASRRAKEVSISPPERGADAP